MDVRLPDGRVVQGVPEGTTKAQLMQKLGMAQPEQVSVPQPQQRTPMQEIGRQVGLTGRYLLEGGLSLPNLVADPIALGINKITGRNQPLPSQQLSEDLTRAGLPSPQGTGEEIVGAMSRALAGTAGSIGAGASLAQGARGVVSNVGRELAKAPITQAGAALGSGAAGEIARQSGGGTLAQIAASLAGGLAGGGVGARIEAPKAAPRMTAQQVRESAGDLYKKAEQAGGVLKATTTNRFLDDIATIRPKDEVARNLGARDFIAENSDVFESMRGQPMTLERATAIDQRLTELLDGETLLGKPTQNGNQILQAQQKLRSIIDNVKPDDIEGGAQGFYALKSARTEWAKAARLRDIEAIIQRAQGMEQPATGIRTGFRSLLNNPNRLRGYSPEQVEAIRKASQTGIVGNLFRAFGSGLVPIGAGIAGSAGGPLGAIASGAAGYGIQQASKAIGENMQMARANKLADLVANGAIQKRDPLYLSRILGAQMGIIANEGK